MKWITRERPKIDRVACPWLVARFIDKAPEFIFVPASDVFAKADELGATPYDVEGAELGHDGDKCSFDAFLAKYKLTDQSLQDLAMIVRGADTHRLDLAPQAPGLLSISLGLSRLCLDDDHRMLAHGFVVYDALYEWLRYGRSELHGWNPSDTRASKEPAWDRLTSGAIEIHVAARRVTLSGRPLDLRPKEFALLVALVAREGRVLSRSFLLQHVWAYEKDVVSRTVEWHVSRLRSQLGAAGRRIEAVRGHGYRWRG